VGLNKRIKLLLLVHLLASAALMASFIVLPHFRLLLSLVIRSQVILLGIWAVLGFNSWDPLATAPSKRFFAPKGPASHQHLLAKAEFLCHLSIVAAKRGFTIQNDRPENTFAITINNTTIWPDHYCELVGPYGRRFHRFFEFDRSTETLVSTRNQQDTWSQKNHVYDAYQNLLGKEQRFRVVPVVTESQQRLDNILVLFGQQTCNRDRQLYVGVHLDHFLAEDDALCHPIFHDHQRKYVPLIPASVIGMPATPQVVVHRGVVGV